MISEDKRWFDSISDHVEDVSPLFDIYGDYNRRHDVHNISLNRYNFVDGNILVTEIPYIISTSDSTHAELI